MNKAYKYRIYPNTIQLELLIRILGCCRKIWNLMLADKIRHYEETGKMLRNTPAQYKKEYPFLKEADSLALANVQLALEGAFRKFFKEKHIGFPRFKSRRRSRKSYTTNNQDGTVRVMDGGIRLPKVGIVKAVIHRKAPDGWLLKSATVSMEPDGSWYCSVLYEYERNIVPVATDPQNAIGLDYKSDGLYTDSNGNCCRMPKFYKKAEGRLAKEQRRLSRKKKDSANYKKQRTRLAKASRKVRNQRLDFLHKTSAAIAKQYDAVCVEDLNMKAMANRKFHNGKATLDNAYGIFLRLLDYKMRDRGKMLIRIDKWFPSSQMCGCCGSVNPAVKDLRLRKWECPVCGALHDRDVNAAVNILNEGLRMAGISAA